MIFVSYAREDHAYVGSLENEMHSAAIPFLRDETLTEGNPFWRNNTVRQLQQCSIMVVISSSHTWTSPWVEQEIRAFDGIKLIVPLDDFPVPADELHRSQSRLVSRDLILEQLRQLASPGTASLTTSYFVDSEANEAQIQLLRRSHLVSEEARLSRFLSTLAEKEYKAPAIEFYGDVVLNIIDGSQLRCVPVRHYATSTGKTAYIGIEPVTNAQYRHFLQASGFTPPPTWEQADFTHPDAPVVGINWFEARAYAAWAGGDLPAEEEWEAAAQGYDEHSLYATSSGNIGPEFAHYAQPLGSGPPLPARTFPPTPLGFYGMCGNTWDWSSSLWGSHRVIRGGGYMDSASFCRIQARYRNAPIDRDCCVSFRVKLTLSL